MTLTDTQFWSLFAILALAVTVYIIGKIWDRVKPQFECCEHCEMIETIQVTADDILNIVLVNGGWEDVKEEQFKRPST